MGPGAHDSLSATRGGSGPLGDGPPLITTRRATQPEHVRRPTQRHERLGAGSTCNPFGMAKPPRRAYVDDVPDDVLDRLRAICAELPDAYEEPAWVGVRWRVRTKTFAHVLAIHEGADDEGVNDEGVDRRVVLTFRSEGDELEVLRRAGPPFSFLGWGRNALGLDLDDRTDWDEVRELVTDSFCVMAPKKLAALVQRPPAE